jgi:hypothetical protein
VTSTVDNGNFDQAINILAGDCGLQEFPNHAVSMAAASVWREFMPTPQVPAAM